MSPHLNCLRLGRCYKFSLTSPWAKFSETPRAVARLAEIATIYTNPPQRCRTRSGGHEMSESDQIHEAAELSHAATRRESSVMTPRGDRLRFYGREAPEAEKGVSAGKLRQGQHVIVCPKRWNLGPGQATTKRENQIRPSRGDRRGEWRRCRAPREINGPKLSLLLSNRTCEISENSDAGPITKQRFSSFQHGSAQC
jgi:hypothetical protein